MGRKKKIEVTVPFFATVAPRTPQTPIPDGYLKRLEAEVKAHWDELGDYYGFDEDRPPHIVNRICAMHVAVDLESAETAFGRIKQAMLIHILAQWAKGKADGPDKAETWEKKAKQAESLAKMLEKKDDIEGARKQYIRADGFRERAERMAKT